MHTLLVTKSRRIQCSAPGSNPGLDTLAQTDPAHPLLPEEQVHRQKMDFLELPTNMYPPETNMTMENPPFEDVFPIENCDFPMSC